MNVINFLFEKIQDAILRSLRSLWVYGEYAAIPEKEYESRDNPVGLPLGLRR